MDWNKIRTEYITSSISYRKLSEKYGVPFNTLQCRAKREGWVADRKKHQDKIVAKMVAKNESKAVDYKSKLYQIAYNVANQLDELTSDNRIIELLAMGVKLRDITGAIKDLEDSLHIKSESDLREQEARIKNLQKQAEESDTADSIVISIEGGNDQWQN